MLLLLLDLLVMDPLLSVPGGPGYEVRQLQQLGLLVDALQSLHLLFVELSSLGSLVDCLLWVIGYLAFTALVFLWGVSHDSAYNERTVVFDHGTGSFKYVV